MYLALPDFSKSLGSAWSDFQILLVLVAFWLILLVGLGVLVLAFFFPRSCQPRPAVPVVYQKASGSVVPICSPQAAPTWATWELSPLSISLWLSLPWKRKRNKWLFTPKLLYQRKKSKTSFTVYCGYQKLAATWQCKLKTPFTVNDIMGTVPSHSIATSTYASLRSCSTWTTHLTFVDARIHPPPGTHTEISPAFSVIFIHAVSVHLPRLAYPISLSKIKVAAVILPLVSEWKSPVPNVSHLWYIAHLLFTSCHLFPIVQWSCSNFQRALAVQPLYMPSSSAQLPPALTHLVLRSASDVTKAGVGCLE